MWLVSSKQQQCVAAIVAVRALSHHTSGAFCNPKSSNEVRMWVVGQLLEFEELVEEVLYQRGYACSLAQRGWDRLVRECSL